MYSFTFPLILKSKKYKSGKNLLFTVNANIFTLAYNQLKKDGKKFKFCRLPFVVNVMTKSARAIEDAALFMTKTSHAWFPWISFKTKSFASAIGAASIEIRSERICNNFKV